MKGIEFINKSIAANKNLPIKLVERVNRYYWKQGIKSRLAKLQVDAIYVKNFGTFRVSNRKLKNHIFTTIRRIRLTLVNTKYKQVTKELKLSNLRETLRLLLEKRNTLAKQYYEQNRRIPEVNTEGICESRQDSGGDNKLDTTSTGYPA